MNADTGTPNDAPGILDYYTDEAYVDDLGILAAPRTGEGMSSALREATERGALEVVKLSDVRVAPFNARRFFDHDALESLAYSLQTHGQMQPIVVRRLPDDDPEHRYEVIAGERRYRALGLTGIDVVRAFVLDDVSDLDVRRLMLAENLQRSELSPWDELQSIIGLVGAELSALPGWSRVVDKADGDEEVAVARVLRSASRSLPGRPEGAAMTLGVATEVLEALLDSVFSVGSTTTLATFTRYRLPLLNWASDVRDALRRGSIPFASAEVVQRVSDERLRATLLERIERGDLSTAQEVREARDGLATPVGIDDDAEAESDAAPAFAQRLSVAARDTRRFEAKLTANERRSLESALRKVNEIIERVNSRLNESA